MSDEKVMLPPAISEVETKEFLAFFARFIVRHYGERCPEVAGGCACCSIWALHDLAHAMLFDDTEERKQP